jgi:3-deoxy-D-manno-octulosonate 8-phosphate phosphatase (KDO 8-P phosphatase)
LPVASFAAYDDKLGTMQAFCARLGIAPDAVVYVGNDLHDIPCLEAAGQSVAVADAHLKICVAAGLVLTARRGKRAVREIYEIVLAPLRSRVGSSSL